MRLIKKLIFGIIGLAVFLVVALVIIYAITVDDSSASIDLSKEYRNVETIVGEEAYDSIDNVSESNYAAESNNIAISITDEELNYYIVQGIRAGVNPDYLETSDYIIKYDDMELKSVSFIFDGDTVQIKIRVNAYFYHTSIKLKASLSLDNKELVFKFEDLKLGFLPIPLDMFKNMVKNFNFKVDEAKGFDFENLEFRMSIDSFLKSLEVNDSFKAIIDNCQFTLKVADSKIGFFIDTTKVFMTAQTISTGNDTGFNEALVAAASAAASDSNHKYSCTISEANFNSKIASSLNDTISSFGSSFTIGGKTFTIKLDKIYYDFALQAFITNLYINNTSSPIKAFVNITPVTEGGVVTKIKVNVNKITLGTLDGVSLDSFEIDDIDISSLGFENVKISDFAFDTTAKTFTVNGTYSIS